MATNDFIWFGIGAGANVESQAAYVADTQTSQGYTVGTVANSADCNKSWRQATMASSLIGLFINTYTGHDCLDDGVISTKLADFKSSISAYMATVLGSAAYKTVTDGTKPDVVSLGSFVNGNLAKFDSIGSVYDSGINAFGIAAAAPVAWAMFTSSGGLANVRTANCSVTYGGTGVYNIAVPGTFVALFAIGAGQQGGTTVEILRSNAIYSGTNPVVVVNGVANIGGLSDSSGGALVLIFGE